VRSLQIQALAARAPVALVGGALCPPGTITPDRNPVFKPTAATSKAAIPFPAVAAVVVTPLLLSVPSVLSVVNNGPLRVLRVRITPAAPHQGSSRISSNDTVIGAA
jgi:hypothetical protein